MVSYRGLCPFCHTEHVEFQSHSQWSNLKAERRALFTCGYCGEGVIRAYDRPAAKGVPDLNSYGGDVTRLGITLSLQWPEERSTDAPPDSPANVASFFKQATASLSTGSYDASGLMFRKALEASTRALAPNSTARSLASRIKELVTNHTLTPALGAWANEVRLGGNDAAHEENPFTKEEAEALHNFTENFLNYAFTMPAAVAKRSAPPGPASGTPE